MKKPKVKIYSDTESMRRETKFAFERAGGVADIVHINDLSPSRKCSLNIKVWFFREGFLMSDIPAAGKLTRNKF